MSNKLVAIQIAKAVRDYVGRDFIPGNVNSRSGKGDEKRGAKLNKLRDAAGGGALHGLDKPKMFAMIANLNGLVKTYQQGACAELACVAYMEAARRAPRVKRQIVEIPHYVNDDEYHAFVVLGLGVRLNKTNLAAQFSSAGDIIVLDPWLKYRHSTHFKRIKGWFYPDEHAQFFDDDNYPGISQAPQYDPTEATTLYPPEV